MRQIKFRAWDTFMKRMMGPKGFGIAFRNEQISHVSVRESTGYTISEYGSAEDPLNQERYKVMQFTGLLDNGKEIYEGDVVKAEIRHDIEGDSVFIGEIAWQTAEASWTIYDPSTDSYFRIFETVQLEILGNTYENPELLPN